MTSRHGGRSFKRLPRVGFEMKMLCRGKPRVAVGKVLAHLLSDSCSEVRFHAHYLLWASLINVKFDGQPFILALRGRGSRSVGWPRWALYINPRALPWGLSDETLRSYAPGLKGISTAVHNVFTKTLHPGVTEIGWFFEGALSLDRVVAEPSQLPWDEPGSAADGEAAEAEKP